MLFNNTKKIYEVLKNKVSKIYLLFYFLIVSFNILFLIFCLLKYV